MISTIKKALVRVHDDENAMETLQVVIIFGIAALVLAGLFAFRTAIYSWVNTALGKFGIGQTADPNANPGN